MIDPNPPRRWWPAVAGCLVALGAFFVYLASNHAYSAGRADFFYLADAFLHGRVSIDVALSSKDVILFDGRIYVPFAPFPAIVLAPLVAIVGPAAADQWEPVINAGLAALVVALAWWTAGRIGVEWLLERLVLVLLLGLGTQVWWVTTRGGVWHTGHLVAMVLTLLLLAEMFGRRRALLMGLLVGAAFLSRAPVALAGPAVALWLLTEREPDPDGGSGVVARREPLPWRGWALLLAGFSPALAFFLWYNVARFGTPFESGYALAVVPEWLDELRRQGLFSPVHVPMNFEYLLLKLPAFTAEFPYFRPDGLGMSVLFTSPGLLLAFRAPWRDARSWVLLLAAGLVLVPTLLYYGGGWLQYGYRYFLDSIPFVWALVALGVVRRGPIAWWGWALILWSVLVGLGGVYWAHHL